MSGCRIVAVQKTADKKGDIHVKRRSFYVRYLLFIGVLF